MSIYMKIKFQNKKASDVTGDVTETSHIGWINVAGINLGVSKQVEYESYRNSTANRSISTAQNSGIKLSKLVCSATPALHDLSNKADTIIILIDVTAPLDAGVATASISSIAAEQTKLSLIIEGGIITNYHLDVHGKSAINEHISIAYEKISIRHYGASGATSSSGFDYIDHKDFQPSST